MEYGTFLIVCCLFILVIWMIQGFVLNLLTKNMGMKGAGIPKTAGVMLLYIIVGITLKIFSLLMVRQGYMGLGWGVFMAALTFGVTLVVFHMSYRDKASRIALVAISIMVIGYIPGSFANAIYAQAFRCPTSSMKPGLEINDFFLVSKTSYGKSDPLRGDIVTFEFPRDRRIQYVKRVIGLPGEELEIREGVVLINGQAIEDPWALHIESPIPRDSDSKAKNFGPFLIPPDSFFLMGDNRNNSMDSRYFGPVARELLIGKAMVRYWPLSRFGNVTVSR